MSSKSYVRILWKLPYFLLIFLNVILFIVVGILEALNNAFAEWQDMCDAKSMGVDYDVYLKEKKYKRGLDYGDDRLRKKAEEISETMNKMVKK